MELLARNTYKPGKLECVENVPTHQNNTLTFLVDITTSFSLYLSFSTQPNMFRSAKFDKKRSTVTQLIPYLDKSYTQKSQMSLVMLSTRSVVKLVIWYLSRIQSRRQLHLIWTWIFSCLSHHFYNYGVRGFQLTEVPPNQSVLLVGFHRTIFWAIYFLLFV